jgi:hypothetical protein
MTPDQELMAKIKATCGEFINEAVAGMPYPPALLAALTANESGGDPNVQRLEPKVLADLSLTLVGKKANYGSIGADDLREWMHPAYNPQLWVSGLLSLATSYGPTQIMGYQAVATHYPISELPTLDKHYPHAVTMLEDFRKRFDLAVDGQESHWIFFFHCWNAGAPKAPTFDPQYSARGLDRMMIYLNL